MEEKNFLLGACKGDNDEKKVKTIPWKAIMLSKKVHGLWITHMCSAWGYYLLAISLPTFSEEVLKLTVINVRDCTQYYSHYIFFTVMIYNLFNNYL